jgi:hypothetical protein
MFLAKIFNQVFAFFVWVGSPSVVSEIIIIIFFRKVIN